MSEVIGRERKSFGCVFGIGELKDTTHAIHKGQSLQPKAPCVSPSSVEQFSSDVTASPPGDRHTDGEETLLCTDDVRASSGNGELRAAAKGTGASGFRCEGERCPTASGKVLGRMRWQA